MGMDVVTGTATNVQASTETSGATGDDRVAGFVRTKRVHALRVGGTPVTLRLPGGAILGDGDLVSVVGSRRAGGFHGLALRNETTGAVHAWPSWPGYLGGALFVAAGIPLSVFLVGIPFLGVGLAALFLAARNTRARNRLDRAPRLAAS